MNELIFKPVPSRFESFNILRDRWTIGTITRSTPATYVRPRTAIPWTEAGITPAELREIADFIDRFDEDEH